MADQKEKHSWELIVSMRDNRRESVCRKCGMNRIEECISSGYKKTWASSYHRPGTKGSVSKAPPCTGEESNEHVWKWDGSSPFRVCDKCGAKFLKALPVEGVVVVAFQRKDSQDWSFEYLPCEPEKENG